MKFYSQINEDERADWRKQEATALALEMLRERSVFFQNESLTNLAGGRLHEATVCAGKSKGIEEAIELLERDK